MTIARTLAGIATELNPPIALTASYTVLPTDSGSHFFYNGSGAITLTFPSTLPVGFFCRVSLASAAGQVLFDKGGRLSYGNASRDALLSQWDVVEIFLSTDNGNPIFLQTYNLGLPLLYAESSAALTRNATTMVAIPGISIPLETNAAYDIDMAVAFTSAITTNTLKVGFSALPTGAKCQLQVDIFSTGSPGTSAAVRGLIMSSAAAVTGVNGSSAVVSTTLMARVTGRIRTAGTAGNLVPTLGSIATTGNVSVAAGDATLSVNKVYDQGRT